MKGYWRFVFTVGFYTFYTWVHIWALKRNPYISFYDIISRPMLLF